MRDWFSIKNEAEKLRIDIYGRIGKSFWDDDAVSAKDILDAIRDANGRPIELHVNSEGGSVFDGFAINTLLRDSASEVTAYIDGLAASAASYIVCAADKVIMSDVAWFMIHEASGLCIGNKGELRKEAGVLENIDNTIAKVYASRSSDYDEQYFLDLMSEETWMDANTAKDLGLVDEISEALPAVAHLDLSSEDAISNAPEEAKSAIMAMAIMPSNQQQVSPSDTNGTIQLVNDEGEPPAGEPRAIHIIDGRIYN